MSLQNRVRPDGEIVTTSHRGTLMGNRGGRIHDPENKLLFPKRRWANRQWISCVTEFKERHRSVMGPNTYTELFFLDEATAFAAGHRPCFECQRKKALSFAEHWQQANGLDTRPSAKEMDTILHEERLEEGAKRTHLARWEGLPNGAFILSGEHLIAKLDGQPILWSFSGYSPMDKTKVRLEEKIECLTPPSILKTLANGYDLNWHESARVWSPHATL